MLAVTEDELLHAYFRQALESYAVSLQHGLDNIFQSLPRFLTLAFEVGDMADVAATAVATGDSSARARTSSASTRVTPMDKLLQHCSLIFRRATQHVASCAWYTALPQLLSQLGSAGSAGAATAVTGGGGGRAGAEVQSLVLEAVVKVLEMHPEQAIWSTTGLVFSRDPFRKKAGEKVLRYAHTRLSESGFTDNALMLTDSKKLFSELLELANDNNEPPPDKRLKIQIGKRLHLMSFLVPVQAALTVSLPRPPRTRRSTSAGGPPGALWGPRESHGGGGGGEGFGEWEEGEGEEQQGGLWHRSAHI